MSTWCSIVGAIVTVHHFDCILHYINQIQTGRASDVASKEKRVGLGYCFTLYQRLRLNNGTPFSRLLRHAGDTEDVFSA